MKDFLSLKIKPLNKKFEKKSSFFSFAIFLVILISIIYMLYTNSLQKFSYKTLKDIRDNIAVFSAYAFGISIAMFLVRRFLKYIQPAKLAKEEEFLAKSKTLKPAVEKFETVNISGFKKLLQFIAIFLRQWHIPISILAFSIILIHAYISLHFGISKDKISFIFGYYIGIIALIDLIALIISGIFRTANKGKKLHMLLGISFIILMLLHITII
ncbi:hypothetical protein [Clostridium sp. B9]|uniref:hypothetical protein n=1 Tax=Clostridium sp. B9 TaxID=3423224 RepID=UPI003D2EA483